MKDHENSLLNCLIFPVAPIVVIVGVAVLCSEIWQAAYFIPGKDGGEAEPALAMIVIPLLLITASVLLAGLTSFTRWIERRSQPGHWWRVLMGVPRVLLVGASLMLFLVAAGFFMGDPLGVSHWQIVLAWILIATATVAFVAQQFRRLIN